MDKIYMMGHSFGGCTALMTASRNELIKVITEIIVQFLFFHNCMLLGKFIQDKSYVIKDLVIKIKQHLKINENE